MPISHLPLSSGERSVQGRGALFNWGCLSFCCFCSSVLSSCNVDALGKTLPGSRYEWDPQRSVGGLQGPQPQPTPWSAAGWLRGSRRWSESENRWEGPPQPSHLLLGIPALSTFGHRMLLPSILYFVPGGKGSQSSQSIRNDPGARLTPPTSKTATRASKPSKCKFTTTLHAGRVMRTKMRPQAEGENVTLTPDTKQCRAMLTHW